MNHSSAKIPSDRQKKSGGHFYEGLSIVLLCVLVAMTAAFIYNETRPPLYRATAEVLLDLRVDETQRRYQSENSFVQRARLSRLVDKLKSREAIERLLGHEEIKNILADEKQFQDTQQRLRAILEFDIRPENFTVRISALDRNPRLAVALVNLLPEVVSQDVLVMDKPLQREFQGMSDEISLSIEHYNKGSGQVPAEGGPVGEVLTGLELIKQQIAGIKERKKQVQNDVAIALQLLRKKSMTLPASFNNPELAALQHYLLQKEVEYQVMRRHSRNLTALSNEIGFTRAKYTGLLEKTRTSLNEELARLKLEENDLQRLLVEKTPEETKNVLKSETKEPDPQAELFHKILQPDGLNHFFAQEKMTITQAATHPLFPDSPHKIFNLALAFVIGLVAGLLWVLGLKVSRAARTRQLALAVC